MQQVRFQLAGAHCQSHKIAGIRSCRTVGVIRPWKIWRCVIVVGTTMNSVVR